MEIRNNLWITKKKDGTIWSNLSGTWMCETTQNNIDVCKSIMSLAKSKNVTDKDKTIDRCIELYNSTESINDKLKREQDTAQLKLTVCEKLINFFKDVNFEPNFRFVNTLARHVYNAREYICNYFKLTDNANTADITEKTKSQEFKQLIEELKHIPLTSTVNNRFKIYYGSQGTGKTTTALKETNNVVIICHSAMLPSDLLEDFTFENGQATFKHSVLWKAMEEGTKICLDEINLLPFESLRFLQSILDNKSEICYKGQTIHIKDGFQIIGTMNLVVNGNVFNLPEPLVDRALDLREFNLTASQLTGAF